MQKIVDEFVKKYQNKPWFCGVGIGENNHLIVFYKDTKPKIHTFMTHDIFWQKVDDIKPC